MADIHPAENVVMFVLLLAVFTSAAAGAGIGVVLFLRDLAATAIV